MPITKNLSKLQKRKADTKLHPLGRKYKQLTTAELRQNKLESLKSKRDDAQERKLERYKFFQSLCQNIDKPELSIEEVKIMCQEYIDRNKEELDRFEKERRPGRAPTNKHLKLKMLYDMENQEYNDGFNVVDVTDPVTVKNLRNWNGSWGGLNMFKMTRVARE